MHQHTLSYSDQGRWKEAEQLAVQVMEIRKTVLGVEHPDTLTAMSNLATMYRDQGMLSEAEKLKAQTMEINQPEGVLP